MKVKELIEKLQTMHQDADVLLESDGIEHLDEIFESWDDSEEGRIAERRGNPYWEVWLCSESRA